MHATTGKASATKYIFVTGGVSSSLGKGIISASLAKLLQARGMKVTIQKLDPYINIDPGTLNPYEHGECYVTDDGAETDLDLGHYERFITHATCPSSNSRRDASTERSSPRSGAATTSAARCRSSRTSPTRSSAASKLGGGEPHVCVITRSAARWATSSRCRSWRRCARWAWEHRPQDTVVYLHLTLVPLVESGSGELKTKPTQHSGQGQLRGIRGAAGHPGVPLTEDTRCRTSSGSKLALILQRRGVDAVIQSAVDADDHLRRSTMLHARGEARRQWSCDKFRSTTRRRPTCPQRWVDGRRRAREPDEASGQRRAWSGSTWSYRDSATECR